MDRPLRIGPPRLPRLWAGDFVRLVLVFELAERSPMSKFSVVLPAAGQSQRFSGRVDHPSLKKIFVALEGRPVWLRTADLFRDRSDVGQIIVAIAPEDQDYFVDRFGSDLAVLGIDWVVGGDQRHESIWQALQKVDDRCGWIAVHDAARPCTTSGEIDQVFSQAKKSGAAILAQPVYATLKRAEQRRVQETVDRRNLWLAQTPQAFEKGLLIQAYQAMLDRGAPDTTSVTDDAQVVEGMGHAVDIVVGLATNLKITTKEDLKLAQAILKTRPSGPDLFSQLF